MIKGDFFEYQLLILTTSCIGAFILQQYVMSSKRQASTLATSRRDEQNTEGPRAMEETSGYSKLMVTYLWVYGMVMFADWLQVLLFLGLLNSP